MATVTFNNKHKSFFKPLNERVEQYFRETQKSKTGNAKLYLKSIILIGTALSIYFLLLLGDINPVIANLLWCLLGFVQATIGFNVMHDANHGSFSQKKWINNIMGFSANIMGVNTVLWKQKHNIIHHTFTNIDGVDIDINKAPLLRMCHLQKHGTHHRFQHLYCLPLYAFTTILMIFISEFFNYFRKKAQGVALRKMKVSEHFIFWISKLTYVTFFIVIPFYVLGWMPALTGFVVMHLTMGLTLAIVFQLAHIVEATHFTDAQTLSVINDEWAVHQVKTTADFATGNKIVSWFTGGLNYQVEHHLFPKISHVHYPAIHQFVKEACLLHSIPLHNYSSLTSAFFSHMRFMKKLGSK